MLTKFIETISELENQLLLSSDQQKNLELILSGKSKDSASVFQREEQIIESIHTNLIKLSQIFQLSLENTNNPVIKNEVNQMREVLQILSDYLGEE